ncbi:hypothetical protein [Piscinibacter sp. XHJ-5]|uniref:hypothetical protein n=1 Tax=Piscinibacter sp. XHJ-5 TaxID=3037797 RepID=UPI002452DD05|nr:hypothetical protein [Piscinibacter sp. XHJ-5]
MALMDILQPYAARPTSTENDFDEVVPQVPADVLGDGLAQAFRSDRTPPFSSMVSQLFGNSNPQLRAGLLNQLIRAVGPAVLAKIAGGALGRFGQTAQPGAAAPGTPPPLSPVDAEQVTPEQVREIAEEAQKHDPSVMERVGGFYAQHPDLVKGLGGAALAIALGQIANRMRR